VSTYIQIDCRWFFAQHSFHFIFLWFKCRCCFKKKWWQKM